MPRHLAILGSTGSIGTAALEVVARLREQGEDLVVRTLSAHANADLLLEQARKWRPAKVVLTGEVPAGYEDAIRACGCELQIGTGALAEAAGEEAIDVVLLAIVGAAGLPAAFAAARGGKTLALANKESLVVGGELLTAAAREGGATILPVDSEHSAIFQAMRCGRRCDVRRVLLTASGGPFRQASTESMRKASVKDALAHPTWQMGGKITIDSATMVNKALEIIEAVRLFDLPAAMIDVVVHPQSVVHSMVEYVDGSTLAQLSPPDMRTPIGYALLWPRRLDGGGRKMDWTTPFSLDFEPPDRKKFPALDLATQVADTGGTAGAIFNAANEIAVESFLAGQIGFLEIVETSLAVLDRLAVKPVASVDDLLEADRAAREQARNVLGRGG